MQNIFNFVLGQTFLSMLCRMEWGLFIFFSCWIAIATVTVILFYPETKGVPLDQVGSLFSSHWYWRRFTEQSIGHKETCTDGRAKQIEEGSMKYSQVDQDGSDVDLHSNHAHPSSTS